MQDNNKGERLSTRHFTMTPGALAVTEQFGSLSRKSESSQLASN